MRFLHCSDVHITGDYRARSLIQLGWRRMPALGELFIKGRYRNFEKAPQTVRQIMLDAERHRAGHVIVSGDVTAYALEEEFDGARAAFEPWASDKQKCTVIPGNHDTYTPGTLRDHRFERRFGHLLESDLPEVAREGPFPFVRLLDGAAVIGLKSARVPLVPGFSFGVIGRRQLEGVDLALADPRLEGRAVLVVVHHAPLTKSGKPDRPLHGLVDAKKLFSRLKGPRFAVLHGHIHHRYHHPATAERPHIFGAGSSTQAGREGYWLIDVKDGQIAGSEMHQPGN
ncbi:MAG: metallophosphoesterase [Archangiaceae bacterium]|nr:metallophosphoesterase [Archangiaceae bacterium]